MEKAVEALAQRGPSSKKIADWVREQIRTNRLVPGQRLVEIDIIRQTGGSRFKVREAFQQLSAQGLLEIEEFRGASVKQTSEDEIRQLYEARAALEGICARDFTLRASEEQIARLTGLAAEMEACADSHTPEKFGKLNAAWHKLIMEGAGNNMIEDLISRLNTPVLHLQFSTFYRGDRLSEAIADHRAIITAIVAGDAAAAEAAMRRHVENGHLFLLQLEKTTHYD